MNIKLTARKPQGEGKELYVVVKNDTDNYQGLWFANSDSHMREQLIESMLQSEPEDDDYQEDYKYVEEDVDYNFYWEKIGETV